jgi:hypothetical protein
MVAAKDVTKLLAGVPKGAWVALSRDEERLIAYDADLNEVLRMAKAAGEADPVVLRVRESNVSLII